MDAAIFYPVGIGKHIVCIDADLPAAAINSLSGRTPNPQGNAQGKENTAVTHRPQKERTKLKPTTKPK